LKILARITKPTNGQVEIHGRVGSLLEVGTGFHAELTGRENVYLNGAILGMSKAEINRKFSEIVAFADVERFIETPVKRYSSGMYMRLAFAVAAHLDPEVLLVDEVLAVGDAAFQKKCMGKIGEVADQGRTVLFVSHNMGVIQNLCNRVFVLEAGRLAFAGGANEAVGFYLSRLPDASSSTSHVIDLRDAAGRTAKYRQILTHMEIYSDGIPFNGHVGVGAGLSFYLSWELDHQSPNFCMTLVFENRFGQRVLEVSSYYQDIEYPPEEQMPGTHTFLCDIPSFTLLPGRYSVGVVADVDGVAVDRVEGACHINVETSDYYGGGKLPQDGYMVIKHRWHHKMGLPSITVPPDSVLS
jgi:lipopolysaccharide transport system ATP-binding protein